MRLLAAGYKLGTPHVTPNAEARATDAAPLRFGCSLTVARRPLSTGVMLQRNARARRAHVAHAAVVGMHALCCGLPALAMLAAALSGATSGIALLADSLQFFHRLLHGYELWILALSAALVTLGAWLEVSSRRNRHTHGFPWLFAFSVLCFLVNVGVVLAHRA